MRAVPAQRAEGMKPSAFALERNNMRTIFWDVETRSAVSLRECGAYIYAIDPTTQALCLVFAIDDEEPQLWLPADPIPSVFLEITADPK